MSNGNVTLQMTQQGLVNKFGTNAVASSGSQIFNLCKWRHLMVKFETNVNAAMWFLNLVTESISWSVVPLATMLERL